MNKLNQEGAVPVFVGIVAALIIGMGGGYAIGMQMNDDNSPTAERSSSHSVAPAEVSSKAADTRVALNQIMRQHVALASVALKDAATGAPETEAAVAALDANSVELASVVGSVYGDEAKESFLTLWRNHIGFFVDYTQGKVAGDEAKMQQAKADIDGYTEEASTFFSAANPNIDKASFKKGLATHGSQVFGIVDAFAAGNYSQAFELEEEAYNHIGAAADSLAGAIVKQFPDKFKN